MIKKTKLIAGFTAIILCFSALIASAAYRPNQDLSISVLTVRDDSMQEIAVVSANSGISAGVTVLNSNTYSVNTMIIMGVYDKNDDFMKYMKCSDTAMLPQLGKRTFTLDATEVELTANEVTAGDTIRLFIWDNLDGMQPMARMIKGTQFASYPKNYSTSVAEYNFDFADLTSNSRSGDFWSYGSWSYNGGAWPPSNLAFFRQIINGDSWSFANNGDFYVYSTNTGIGVKGGVERYVFVNYTIGSMTAGKDLKIDGHFYGDPANFSIFISDNTDTLSTSPLIFNSNLEVARLVHYPNLPDWGAGMPFELTIPADEALRGRDIIFGVHFNSHPLYGPVPGLNSNVNVTITAEDPE